jgi:glycosidase
VPYLVEEPGVIVHSAGTHAVLRAYEAYVRSVKPDVFTVGEVSDSTTALLSYYPDQLDDYFAFEVADSIVSAVRNGSAKGLLPPVLRLQRDAPPGRWSPFVRNHDQPRTRTVLGGDMAKAKLASFILLTLPGMPFVYYGEEIGMTGGKPDERIRTPMQWRPAPAAGFTRGAAWERLQGDSLTITVESEDKDPASILNLHRRMIHLRASNSALGDGALIPLASSSDAVAAYVRREGNRAVLVVANLGTTALANVALSSDAGALPPGSWRLRTLLGGTDGAALDVADDGRLHGFTPLATLAPLHGYLFELSPARGRRSAPATSTR